MPGWRPWYRRRWVLAVAAATAVAVWNGSGLGDVRPDPGSPSAGRAADPSLAAGRSPASQAGVDGAGSAASTTATRSPSREAPPASALAVLAGLLVKGRAPTTGYDRDEFGQAWLDTDRNGCDTRNDILGRDLTEQTVTAGTSGCRVEAGTLADPYTGTRIDYVRGNDSVDIDHVVSLSNAWQTGAFRWDIGKRAAFANDPVNLLAADSSANRQKGDGDTATWLPSNKGFRCAYAARQVAVKAKYGLWVTAPEREAMARILSRCPSEPVPTSSAPTVAPVAVNRPHRADSVPQHSAAAGTPVSYENCDAVRAAGAAPIRSGDAGYAAHLDRDGDGSGCE